MAELIQVLELVKSGLEVDLCGIKMKNPLMLASDILGVTAETILNVGAYGAGAVVTKSIGMKPRAGHPNPTLIELPHGLLNAMGLPNPGIDEFGKELAKVGDSDLPVIGSIFGNGAREFRTLAGKMEGYGVSGLELNLSCPHAKGLGLEFGSDPRSVRRIVTAVREQVDIPVFAKLTPHTPRIVELGAAAADAGADALVAVNTIKAMSIDINTGKPVLGNAMGGYSGPGLKPIGVRAVYELSSELDVPVIGVGGIMTAADAIEYMMAGASAVQIGSAVFYSGPGVFGTIRIGMLQFLKRSGYSDINKIIGIGHR